MSRGSVNNPQLTKNSGELPHYQFRIKAEFGQIQSDYFPNVINNYVLSFSSFLNKVKDKINGF